MKYLSDDRINTLADLTYIFNKKKAELDGFDRELIKAEFRQMFQDNASLFFKKVEGTTPNSLDRRN